jgi:hypothetical protein
VDDACWWVLIHSGHLKITKSIRKTAKFVEQSQSSAPETKKKQGQLAARKKADTKSVHMQTSRPVRPQKLAHRQAPVVTDVESEHHYG